MNKGINNILDAAERFAAAGGAALWRGNQIQHTTVNSLSSGFDALDALLPGGGWPVGTLTEILLPQEGIGELRLLMPALARLAQQKRWLAWIAPPYIPYAPALKACGVDLSKVLLVHPKAQSDHWWAIEQALRSGTCGAVLAWVHDADPQRLRRLQLAAEAGNAWGILFRRDQNERQATPASLRLRLEHAPDGVAVNILKRRGGWPTGPVQLHFNYTTTNSAFSRSAHDTSPLS